jgi:hypothetical protein
MQVKVFPATTDLIPAFLHTAPAFATAVAGDNGVNREIIKVKASTFLCIIPKSYSSI